MIIIKLFLRLYQITISLNFFFFFLCYSSYIIILTLCNLFVIGIEIHTFKYVDSQYEYTLLTVSYVFLLPILSQLRFNRYVIFLLFLDFMYYDFCFCSALIDNQTLQCTRKLNEINDILLRLHFIFVVVDVSF